MTTELQKLPAGPELGAASGSASCPMCGLPPLHPPRANYTRRSILDCSDWRECRYTWTVDVPAIDPNCDAALHCFPSRDGKAMIGIFVCRKCHGTGEGTSPRGYRGILICGECMGHGHIVRRMKKPNVRMSDGL
jgi:hypothetical protein